VSQTKITLGGHDGEKVKNHCSRLKIKSNIIATLPCTYFPFLIIIGQKESETSTAETC